MSLGVALFGALLVGVAWGSEEAFFVSSDPVEGNCGLNARLMWTAETGSAAYAAPHITDLHSDGSKEIVLPTFTHYVEALDGATGHDVHGWPFAHPKLRTQASVKPLDLEHDGTPELMVSTYTGEFIFFRENGTAVQGATIKLQPVEVPKKWTDFSTAHLREVDEFAEHALDEVLAARHKIAVRSNAPSAPKPQEHQDPKLAAPSSHTTHGAAIPGGPSPAKPSPQGSGRKLQQAPTHDDVAQQQALDDMDAAAAADDDEGDVPHRDSDHDDYPYDDYYYGDDVFGQGDRRAPSHEHAIAGTDGKLSPEARASLDLIFHPELFEAAHNEIFEPDQIFAPRPGTVVPPPLPPSSDKVQLDAHILATPAVADLDYDGSWDIIAAVSYFLDAETYAAPENLGRLPSDIDTKNYVKGMLVVLDSRSGRLKWSKDLGLTTKNAAFPAYAVGSPTVVNLDDDGILDIVIGTSSGVLYAFDAHGNVKRGWPVKVGPMHGQPLAEDVNGDGRIDICVTDVRGTVSCFDAHGTLVWDRTVQEPLADGAVAGDVNGDGIIDVVVCTTKGKLWALDGRMGAAITNFPVTIGPAKKPAGVVGTALLVNVNNTDPPRADDAAKGLHIVVTALDGAMYIVSGTTGCVERHDLGHHSYTPVLADDVIGNGRMNLIVTTLTGQVMVFETDAAYSPLKAWPSQVIGLNGMTARDGYLGVQISPESRQPHAVRGESFQLMFEIVDERHARHTSHVPTAYFVAIHVGHQLLLFSRLYLAPGKHTVRVPVPFERKYATVFVSMRLPNGQHFEDSVPIAFNMHFMDGIKFLILLPFLGVMSVLYFVHKRHEVSDVPDAFDEAYLRMHLARRRRVRHPGLG